MTDEQTATEIMRTFYDNDGPSMHAAIVRALQAARESAIDTHANGAVLRMCHEARMMNGIVDYSDPNAVGVVRKVLGTLPVTADGCVAVPGALVWHPSSVSKNPSMVYGFTECEICVIESYGPDGFVSMSKSANVAECYSTPEAAEAAKEGKA